MNIFKLEKKENNFSNLTFYLSFNKLKQKNIYQSISYIQYIIDIKNANATIIILETNLKYRNKGYATKLLLKSIYHLKKMNIQYIELDDMSNNSWKKNNIYLKHGFQYINNYPEPEMILYINS
jgi:ribosomal protein S18 acetylase RimI-like enzyme